MTSNIPDDLPPQNQKEILRRHIAEAWDLTGPGPISEVQAILMRESLKYFSKEIFGDQIFGENHYE